MNIYLAKFIFHFFVLIAGFFPPCYSQDEFHQSSLILHKREQQNPPQRTITAIFSPIENSHDYLDKLVTVIENTQESLEIALYGFESFKVFKALERASKIGVSIRMLFHGASKDRQKNRATTSHLLEEAGIDLRYVNKANHHKFIISDHHEVITSSGNWNHRANDLYDENTLSSSDSELLLRYRAEFEYLWNHSREFGRSFPFSHPQIDPNKLISLITDDENVDAIFTSSNYRTYVSSRYGLTFAKISPKQNVAAKVVNLINEAKHSIYIAANYLRSRPISEALITKKTQNSDIDIKVYLDGKEYISKTGNRMQSLRRKLCLSQATTAGRKRHCLEKNFLYSYELVKAGIEVRFKIYAYKWHHKTAQSMHHKYAIFDRNTVATGSYNYSYNSETNSMENLVIFNHIASPETVKNYQNNFEKIWNTGVQESYYNDILLLLHSASRFIPVLFPSMSLSYSQVQTLRDTIEAVCPTLKGSYFRNHRKHYAVFLRNIHLKVDHLGRITTVKDIENDQFISNYDYDKQDINIEYLFENNQLYNNSYQYDEAGKIIYLRTPKHSLRFIYDNNDVRELNTGRGLHTWHIGESIDGNPISRYSTPETENYLSVEWNVNGYPLRLSNADSSEIEWSYNHNDILTEINSEDRHITFTRNNEHQALDIITDDGENLLVRRPNFDNLKISYSGTLPVELEYTIEEDIDKKTHLKIAITSRTLNKKGSYAEINYLRDHYGKIIKSKNLIIKRKPYLGNIVSIKNGRISETRIYNNWELLTSQKVTYGTQIYYEANYQYDKLHRIKTLTEIVQGEPAKYEYTYDAKKNLETVYKNGRLAEKYTYDAFGNRTSAYINNITYSYLYKRDQLIGLSRLNSKGDVEKETFLYNPRRQLQAVIYKNSTQTTSKQNYVYDVFGNLQSVLWRSKKQAFKYDPYDRRIAVIHDDQTKYKLVYGLGEHPIAQLDQHDKILHVFVYADEPIPLLMRNNKKGDQYLVSDIRGSLRMVIDTRTGAINQQISYDSFGNIIENTNPDFTPFGFAGGLYSYKTGLVHFGVRDYLPRIGLWTTEDPIGFWGGGINFYVYVDHDPVNHTDPSGLSGRGGYSRFDFSNQRFKSFTKSNFRTNLARLTGINPKGKHAHHWFPQKHEKKFKERGINIHDPRHGAWWEVHNHLKNAKKYNVKWGEFLFEKRLNKAAILDFGRKMMKIYEKL